MEHQQILIIFACCFGVCTLCQWIAWRVKLPAIIFLLLAGITGGPLLGVFQPDLLLGDLFSPFVSFSVAIILFEGALTLKFKELSGLERVVRNMLTFGLLLTWLVTAGSTYIFTEFGWELAFLFGAITVVTGPTVIAPLLRTVRPTASVASILRWEGIVIDPIGASLAVLVYEFIAAGGGRSAWGHTATTFGLILITGLLAGGICGYCYGLALRKHWLPEFLQNITTLGVVFVAYVLAESVQPESGLVAVTVLGMWLANMRGVDLTEILAFKESLSVLLISLLFLMLAARLDFASLRELGWSGILVFLVVQFVARPLNVLSSTMGSNLKPGERYLLSWIAPRGIVAAAISSLFALKLQEAGMSDAHLLTPLTFVIIIGTVLLQSLTARPLAQMLGVALPEPDGFLIVGANLVARTIGHALQESGVRVLLADNGYHRIGQARVEGLDTWLGNPISEQADRHMNLVGIGRMLALSPYETENQAAVMHYRDELGRAAVFSLRPYRENRSESMRAATHHRGNQLFREGVTFRYLASRIGSGAEIRKTRLTVQFSWEDFLALHNSEVEVLFFIDPKGRLIPVSEDSINPGADWSLISLFPADKEISKER